MNSQLDASHRRQGIDVASFIFTDIKALYDLNLTSYIDLAYAEISVVGYELYLVEQWVAARRMSSVIASFTGNSQDTVRAVQVILPRDPALWPGKLSQYHAELKSIAQPRIMPDGHSTMYVTNLSGIPSSLNILHIETGDMRTVWPYFKVNYDLKMLHCAGRSSLLLSYPATSAVEKFLQLYKFQIHTRKGSAGGNGGVLLDSSAKSNSSHSDESAQNDDGNRGNAGSGSGGGAGAASSGPKYLSIAADTNQPDNYQPNKPPARGVLAQNNEAVAIAQPSYDIVYMVELVQISLRYFNSYKGPVDGLLCKTSNDAIEDWWGRYGTLYLGIDKPRNEPAMGPTAVAGILSLVLACYFKLSLEDCMNSRDPFDSNEFHDGVALFQKKYNLDQKYRSPQQQSYSQHGPGIVRGCLDLCTLAKLFEVTEKYSNHDLLKFKKLLKSRVLDLTGKGNPITLSHEILTADLETLVSNIHGGSLGLLWKGKGRSRTILNCDNTMSNFCNYTFQRGNPTQAINEQNERTKRRIMQEAEQKKRKRKTYKFDPNMFVESRRLPPDLNEADMESDTSSDSETKSNHTVSSMFCNYDKSRYSTDIDINKWHFDEYKRRNSLPRINDGTTVDIMPDPLSDKLKARRLYRSNSFSTVSNVVDRWQLPFDASVVRIARNLRRLETELANQKTLDDMEDSKFAPHSDQVDNRDAEEQFLVIKARLQDSHDKYANQSIKFERKANVLENKQRLLYTEINEINSLTSKLKYDVRLLEFRMRDVEDSINHFDKKINSVKKALIAQNGDVADALECVTDERKFDGCLETMMCNKDLCYKGLSVKLMDPNLFAELKKNIMSWVSYLFSSFSTTGNDYKSIQAKTSTSEF
ncbi:hypothetical protein DAKH74_040470 [Maudiozyma humilis]|uniref:STB6-like N-terminal domain-containing protein n=1 Tax=Maudiozyma humilis TaxID=51915 RepID=A0AAV5S334_MAUHU|nr:hypothetical protein DAKH74_040470 [Kazachstania humilis]